MIFIGSSGSIASGFAVFGLHTGFVIGAVATTLGAGASVVAATLTARQRELGADFRKSSERLALLREQSRQREWVEWVEGVHEVARASPERRAAAQLQCTVHRLMGQSCAFGADLTAESPCRVEGGPYGR